MPLLLRCAATLLLLLAALPTYATHITGAELTYTCVNPASNTYQVRVRVYRDCENGQASFDNTIRLFIFRHTNKTLYTTQSVFLNQTGIEIIPVFWDACTGAPYNLCVEYVDYVTTISLPPLAGGFDVGWARCCRNNVVTNIQQNQGITVLGRIPGSDVPGCNSMPKFNQIPPVFLCNGQPFSFDHSATDPDGDSLVYSIVQPLNSTNFQGLGATQFAPVVSAGGFGANPMGPPPYNPLTFLPGFSFLNPFGGGNFAIDPQSGLLTLTPVQTGLSVFAVSVKEYRNGVLLSENIRDFQISVINCAPQGNQPSIGSNLAPVPGASPDTVYVDPLESFCYTMSLSDPTAGDTVELFAVSAAFGIGGTATPPLATLTTNGTNPVTGTVCWTPACAYAGDTVRLIVGGRDVNDCPGYNVVFDTVWVIVDTLAKPSISHVLPDGSSPDTVVLDPLENFCFTLNAADADPEDTLVFIPEAGPWLGAGGTATLASLTGTNPISASVCWAPPCDLAGQTLQFIVQVQDTNRCEYLARDTLTVQINPLAPVGAAGDTAICVGESTPLTAFGGVSYLWSPATGLSSPTVANPTATPTDSTLYSVAITDGFGCVRNDSVLVRVNPLPTPDAGPDTTLCPGQTLTLQGSGGQQFAWTPANLVSNPGSPTPTVSPTQTTTYTLTVTDKNNCVASDPVTVTVMTAEAGTAAFSCSYDSVQLGASGGISYSWTPALGLSDPTIANPLAAPGQTTTYTVTVTDAQGCVDSDTVTVGVYPLPAANAGPDQFVCLNDTLTLTAAGGVSYQWQPGPSIIGINSAAPQVFPQTPTRYYVLVTDANGCANVDSVDIGVWSLPIAEAGPDTTKCGDLGIALGASGGLAYAWSPTVGLSDPLVANPVANPDSSTVYTVTVTDANGCSAQDSMVLTVMYANAGSDLAVCIGDSLTLQASGGIAYQWQASPVLLGGNSATPTVFPTVDTEFIVTATDASGCVDDDTVLVQVNPLPSTTTQGSDPYVCSGGGTVVSATGGSSYQWAPANVFNDPTLASPTAFPTYSGATLDSTWRFFVTVTDSNGCVAQDSLDQVVRVLPIISVSNDTVNCPGGSVPLMATGGNAYLWKPAFSLDDPTIAAPIASPDTTTIYTAIVTAVWGCSDSAEVKVIVMEPEAGPDQTICAGDSILLAANGGVGYLWTPAQGLSNANIASPLASPAQTTTYTVTVTDSLGCVDTDTIRITVNPLPPAEAGADQAICFGDTTTLQASGGLSYQWLNPVQLSDANQAQTLAWPDSSVRYRLLVTDGNGCQAVDSLLLTVNPLPLAEAGPDQTQCGEDSVTLQASGGTQYQWMPTTGLSSPTEALTLAAPDSTTRYLVTVTDGNGCVQTDSVLIRTMYATTGPDLITCPEDSVNLLAGSIGGLPVAYVWTPGLSLGRPNSASPSALPGVTTRYQVTVTDSSGCVDTASQLVTVFPVPAANAGPDTAICRGESLQLQASGGVSYLWRNDPALSVLTVPNPVASPLEDVIFSVEVTDGNGCQRNDSVTIAVNPLPDVDAGRDTTICALSAATLQASGASLYQWTPATSLSSPNTSRTQARPDSSDTFLVLGIDDNGCENTDSVRVNVRALPRLSGETDYAICLGQTAYLTVDGANGYRWNTGEVLPILEVTPAAPSNYWVIPIGPEGCEGERFDISVFVERNLPIADFRQDIEEGFYPLTVNFQNQSQHATQYLWRFGTGDTSSAAAPAYTYQIPGEFAVTLIADNDIGCPDSLTLNSVNALDFVAYFPNAFTPNGDGENDEFRIRVQSFQSVTFQVFDRWGRLVYLSQQPDIRWDGRKGGVRVQEGVYPYTFRGITFQGEVIERNGSITLIR